MCYFNCFSLSLMLMMIVLLLLVYYFMTKKFCESSKSIFHHKIESIRFSFLLLSTFRCCYSKVEFPNDFLFLIFTEKKGKICNLFIFFSLDFLFWILNLSQICLVSQFLWFFTSVQILVSLPCQSLYV